MSTDEFAEGQLPSPPRILVGVDGSDDAMRAVMYALGTAERTGYDIWLVHAVDDGVLTSGWGVVYDPTILSSVGEEALAVAKLFLSDNGFPAERVRSEVLMGHPTAVLADPIQQVYDAMWQPDYPEILLEPTGPPSIT
jgi:nucleotide-binding universal stress UspA family protein